MTNQSMRVAAIQAASVFLDRAATTEKACRLIREAGKEGAEFVVFPEGFLPAHPTWYHHHTATGALANRLAVDLFENSVEIPGPETEALADAAREAGLIVIMGLCERLKGTLGTMFNSQICIDSDGTLLGKHQKFMPTVGERLVHVGGHGDTFGAWQARAATVSALVCGENTNALAIFALATENTRVHGASWPPYFALTADPMRNHVLANSQAFAIMSNAFVVSACAVVDTPTLDRMEASQSDRNILADPARTGGSVIVAPNGAVLAGPMGSEEGILYADCDFGLIVRTKLRQDFAGHYHRPDIFSLNVNRTAPQARRGGVEPRPDEARPEEPSLD